MKHILLLFAVAALAQTPRPAKERLQSGLEKLNRSGQLAQQGKFAEAQPLMNEALAELDAVVASDPENAELRLMRGSIYSRFPAFLNKTSMAREDLEIAARDGKYKEQAEKALAAMGAGKRFTQISNDVGQIMAVSSVTFPGKKVNSRDELPPLLASLLRDMESYPGFLGNHVLTSADQEGMVLVFTWWSDKQSLAKWVDGPGHQGVIREVYSKKASTGMSTQVAAELFQPLPGGQQINGGLTPRKALLTAKGGR